MNHISSIWLERVYNEGVSDRVYGLYQSNYNTVYTYYINVNDLYDDTK